jgi:hypothetical protein
MQTGSVRTPDRGEPKRPQPVTRSKTWHSTPESQELRDRRELLVRQLMAEGCDQEEAEEVLRLTVS